MPFFDATGRYPDTTIDLRTRSNAKIENRQIWELSRFEWAQLGELLKRFTKAEPVSDACPVYNCHGLTFGSRRTTVSPAVLPILTDDGFDNIPEKDARAGDIIIYLGERGDVVHSGFVVRCERVEIVAGATTVLPIIWSKWGKGYEMIHPVGECPYLESGNYVLYYRLKRWEPSIKSTAQLALTQ